jgi:CO/xanthine dehydrogenase Mo-binding subunit
MGLGIQGRDYDHCLNRALARSDWEQRGTRREEARSRGRLRGIGLACYATTAMGQESGRNPAVKVTKQSSLRSLPRVYRSRPTASGSSRVTRAESRPD